MYRKSAALQELGFASHKNTKKCVDMNGSGWVVRGLEYCKTVLDGAAGRMPRFLLELKGRLVDSLIDPCHPCYLW